MGNPPDEHSERRRSADPGASQTDWEMIFQAARGDVHPARDAWDRLARRYWPAIYAYVRSTGRDVQQAADLTQGFVCDVMVDRGLVEAADPARGRFRTLLLTALRNYMAEQHRRATRRKRAPAGVHGGPGPRLLRIDGERGVLGELSTYATPEAAFSAQWSASLVQRVLDDVRTACIDEALAEHWAVFEMRVVRPMLYGDPPVAYSVIVDRLNLKDAAQAANMMITVKRRFSRALLAEVGSTVSDPSEVEDELLALLRELERPR